MKQEYYYLTNAGTPTIFSLLITVLALSVACCFNTAEITLGFSPISLKAFVKYCPLVIINVSFTAPAAFLVHLHQQ